MVIALLLAGATLAPESGWYLLLIPGYVLLRTTALRVFSRMAVTTFVGDSAPGIGRALLGHGVLASAISLAFAQRHLTTLPVGYATTILGGVLFTDLFAMGSLRRYLADAGEIKALANRPTGAHRPVPVAKVEEAEADEGETTTSEAKPHEPDAAEPASSETDATSSSAPASSRPAPPDEPAAGGGA